MEQHVFVIASKTNGSFIEVFHTADEAEVRFRQILGRRPWAIDFIVLREATLTFKTV